MTSPQAALPGVPESVTPNAYVSPALAQGFLLTRYNLTATVAEGHVLVASMRLDEEGPWLGVKSDPTQERDWPRTFRYGWPNLIATPSPVMVTLQYPGAWYLNYEGVVPQQIVDWVCLEAYRLVTLPFDRVPTSESVTGATVHYAPPPGEKGGIAAELDHLQSGLISPFQVRQGHRNPFLNFNSL